jgi:hypothetical protein
MLGTQHGPDDIDRHEPAQVVRFLLVDTRILAGYPGVVDEAGQGPQLMRMLEHVSHLVRAPPRPRARPPRARMADITDSAPLASAA